MTSTNELRRMLDERGVKWNATDTYRLLVTSWKDANGHDWAFMEHQDGNFSKLTAYHLTPAQAIAATLGTGTCEMEYVNDWMGWHCKSCDNLRMGLPDQKPKFCPNCGRRVMEVSS